MLAQDALDAAYIQGTKLNEELRQLYQKIAWLEALIENDRPMNTNPQDTGEIK